MAAPIPDPARVLHPAMQAVLARAAQWRQGKPDRYGQPFPVARELLLAERRAWQDPAVPACDTDAFTVRRERTVAVRRYRAQRASSAAADAPARPLLVYLHGGGWCVGSMDTHDALVRHLAGATGCEVWSVDYALAPESPFPAGLLDSEAVIAEAIRQRGAGAVCAAGDSAGANLALCATLLRHGRGQALPAGLVLYYGVFTDDVDDASSLAYGDGRFGLSRTVQQRYLAEYLSGGSTPADRRCLFPLDAETDLRGLPRVLLVAAGCDMLHDQSLRMQAALAAHGVPADLMDVPGVVHGFLGYGSALPQCAAVFERTAGWLAQRA